MEQLVLQEKSCELQSQIKQVGAGGSVCKGWVMAVVWPKACAAQRRPVRARSNDFLISLEIFRSRAR